MRPASQQLPTLGDTGEPPRGALAGAAADADFDPVAVLKALRVSFDGRSASSAPPPAAAIGATAGENTGLSFDFANLPRKGGTAALPLGATSLSASLEDFTRTVVSPREHREAARNETEEAITAARRAAIEETRAEEAEKAAAALAAAERSWAEDTAQALSAQLDQAFVDLHNRLADAIAGALSPVLEEAMRARALERFSSSLERLFGKRGGSEPITISGPEPLLEAFRALRGGDTAGLKLVASDDSELVASVNDTTLRTTIKAWASTLAAATGSRHGKE